MSWIQLRFHRELVPQAGPNQVAYKVTASVDAAFGIPAQLFVVTAVGDVYDHAATLYDLINFPGTEGEATSPAAPSPFYRVASVVQTFDRPAGVDAFVDYVKATLQQTNTSWSLQSSDAFGGDDVSVIQ